MRFLELKIPSAVEYSDNKTTTHSAVIGLILTIGISLFYTLFIGPVYIQPVTSPIVYALIGFSVFWALTLCILLITKFAEARQLESIGFKPLSGRTVAIAAAIGILLSLAVPLLASLANQLLPISESGGILDTATNHPAWVILLGVLTAGVTEEIIFRSYAIERLFDLTGNIWSSALVSLVASCLYIPPDGISVIFWELYCQWE